MIRNVVLTNSTAYFAFNITDKFVWHMYNCAYDILD